jgi:hypothetical protein
VLQVTAQEGEHRQLRSLLDQADAEEQGGRRVQEIGLQQRRGEHAEDSTGDERAEQQFGRDLAAVPAAESPHHEAHRHQEAA